MCGQHSVNLVKSILALRNEIVVVTNVSSRPVLILRADAGEENHCTAPEAFHGDGLREDALCPGAVGELLLLERRRRRLLRSDRRDNEAYYSGGDYSGKTTHVNLLCAG